MRFRTYLLVLVLAGILVALVPAASFADGVDRDLPFEDQVVEELLAPPVIDLSMWTPSAPPIPRIDIDADSDRVHQL